MSGLRLGLTSADLNTMPFGRLAHMLDAWAAMNGPDKPRGPRKGTQADINALLM